MIRSVVNEPAGETYRAFLEFFRDEKAIFASTHPMHGRRSQIEARLAPWRLLALGEPDQTRRTAWEEWSRPVWLFRFDFTRKDVFEACLAVERLYDWEYAPNSLFDFYMLRRDDTPMFRSISHEKLTSLTLTPAEEARFMKNKLAASCFFGPPPRHLPGR